MEIQTEFDEGACVMALAGEMNIYHANEIKQAIANAMEKCAELEINLARVTEMDTAGIQLLILAKREMAGRRKTLRLSEHSPAVLEVMELYDLAAVFGDPLVIRAGRARSGAEGGEHI